jgi:hypothetical protein
MLARAFVELDAHKSHTHQGRLDANKMIKLLFNEDLERLRPLFQRLCGRDSPFENEAR